MAVLALVGSVVVQKSGRFKWALVLGGAVSAVGAGLLYTVNENTSYSKIAGFQVSSILMSERTELTRRSSLPWVPV